MYYLFLYDDLSYGYKNKFNMDKEEKFWTWTVHQLTEKNNISIQVKERGKSDDRKDNITAHIR